MTCAGALFALRAEVAFEPFRVTAQRICFAHVVCGLVGFETFDLGFGAGAMFVNEELGGAL